MIIIAYVILACCVGTIYPDVYGWATFALLIIAHVIIREINLHLHKLYNKIKP